MFLTIINAITALASAVPEVRKIIDRFIEIYTEKQLSEIETQYVEIKEKRYAIMQSIKKSTSYNERKALSVILADLYRMSERSDDKKDGATLGQTYS